MGQLGKSLARACQIEVYRASNGFMLLFLGEASGSAREIELVRVSESEIHAYDVPCVKDTEITDPSQIVIGTAMWVPRQGVFLFEGSIPEKIKLVSAEGERELEVFDMKKFF